MPIIQPVLQISDSAAEGIANGTLIRKGGTIVEAGSNKIYEWAKDVTTENNYDSNQVIEQTSDIISKSKFSTGEKIAIVAGTGVSFLIVGWCAYKFCKFLFNKKNNKSNVKTENNTEFNSYLENINNQTMTLDSIKSVMNFIDKLSENKNISIKVSDSEMTVMRNIVVKYLIELCMVNNIEIENKQLTKIVQTQSIDTSILEIKEGLKIQEKIFMK